MTESFFNKVAGLRPQVLAKIFKATSDIFSKYIHNTLNGSIKFSKFQSSLQLAGTWPTTFTYR